VGSDVDIITVDASNVDRYGFFCYKSKPKTAGYRQKRQWLEERFAEGLRLTPAKRGHRQCPGDGQGRSGDGDQSPPVAGRQRPLSKARL
jgi:hypothetical protein